MTLLPTTWRVCSKAPAEHRIGDPPRLPVGLTHLSPGDLCGGGEPGWKAQDAVLVGEGCSTRTSGMTRLTGDAEGAALDGEGHSVGTDKKSGLMLGLGLALTGLAKVSCQNESVSQLWEAFRHPPGRTAYIFTGWTDNRSHFHIIHSVKIGVSFGSLSILHTSNDCML